MSFLFGSTKDLPAPEQKPLGLEEKRLVSDERGRPVPVIYGQQPIAATPLSNPFNQRAIAVEEEVAKEEIVVGFNYYADIAMLVCAGPVDKLVKILFDNEEVWPLDGSGGVSRDTEDYINVTVQGYGTWKFYWGTDTQDFDFDLVKLSENTGRNPGGVASGNVPEEHPAYVGQCYFVAKNHFLGYNRTSLQNIEVVVARYPAISWLTNPSIQGDCDIPTILADSLTNKRYGLGLRDAAVNDTRINQASLTQLSADLKAQCTSLSPVLTRTQSYADFLRRILESFDGYWRSDENGRFSAGVIRDSDFTSAIPDIDESCMAELPELDIGSYKDTVNEVFVVFTNRDDNYRRDSVPGFDSGNHAIRSEPEPLVLERRDVTRPLMAHQMAQLAANKLGQIPIKGSVSIRKSKRQGLKAGMAFWLHYASYGICHLPCRATKIVHRDPDSPVLDIEFEVHRSAGGGFSGTVFVAPQAVSHTPVEFTDAIAIELPYDPVISSQPLVGFLAARPSVMTLKYHVWREKAVDTYEKIREVNFFAYHGTLDAGIIATDTELSVTLDGVDKSLPEITSEDAAALKYVALIGDELMAIHTPVVAGTDQYTLTIVRGRYDTKGKAHSLGDDVWIFKASSLRASVWNASQVDHDDTDTQTFKFQPQVQGQTLDLSEIEDTIDVVFSDRALRPWKPRDLTAKGTDRSALTYQDGDDIEVSWTTVNRDGGDFLPDAGRYNYWVLEWRETDDTILKTIEYAAGTGTATITYEEWSGWFDPAADFKLRIYGTLNSIVSREYEEVTVVLSP